MTTLIFPKNQRQCASFSIKRGYPVSVVQAGHRRAQQIDRQSAQTARKENTDRIPFTLTFHPHNRVVKSIILKKTLNYFKTIQRQVLSFENLH